MRTAEIIRKTAETDIVVQLNLDGTGKAEIATGCGFLDHMLVLFSHHGCFDLKVMWESVWARPLPGPWERNGASPVTATSCCLWMRR